MAVDTRDERASAIHVGLPWRGLLPLADGAVSQADRQHAATMYCGILAAAPAIEHEQQLVEECLLDGDELRIRRYSWWADDDGDLYRQVEPIEGAVLRLTAQHDASVAGATYDVKLYDELGWDILNGLGVGLSFNTTEYAQIYATVFSTLRRSVLTAGPLWLEITAGEDTQGTLDLLWTPRLDAPLDRLGLEQ